MPSLVGQNNGWSISFQSTSQSTPHALRIRLFLVVLGLGLGLGLGLSRQRTTLTLVVVHELVTKTGQGGVRIDIIVRIGDVRIDIVARIGDVRSGHGLVGSLALCKSPQEVALRLLVGLESKAAVCAVLHHSVQPTSYLDVPF